MLFVVWISNLIHWYWSSVKCGRCSNNTSFYVRLTLIVGGLIVPAFWCYFSMKLGLVLSNFFMFPNLLIIMIVGDLEGDLHSKSIQNAYTIIHKSKKSTTFVFARCFIAYKFQPSRNFIKQHKKRCVISYWQLVSPSPQTL